MRIQTLVKALIESGLRQREIAKHCKIAQGTVSKIKNGTHRDIPLSVFRRLESLYNERIELIPTKYRRKNKVRQKGV